LPLRAAALVCAFTSVLDAPDRALRELGRTLMPGGQLAVSFLDGEAPATSLVLQWAGLRLEAGPLPAGQDRLFVLRKDAP
jgi:SAM-dependent methyltransferase